MDYYALFNKPTRAFILASLSKAQNEPNTLFSLTIGTLSQNKEDPPIFAFIKCDITMHWYCIMRGKRCEDRSNRIMQFVFTQCDKGWDGFLASLKAWQGIPYNQLCQ